MIEVRDIPDFNDYLESLLVQNECDDLEFKSAAGGFPGNFWDTYSAFANSEGGTIVLGVQEKKGKFFLDNLTEEQVEKYRKDFWNNVNNRSTISVNLMHADDLVLGNYKGKARRVQMLQPRSQMLKAQIQILKVRRMQMLKPRTQIWHPLLRKRCPGRNCKSSY